MSQRVLSKLSKEHNIGGHKWFATHKRFKSHIPIQSCSFANKNKAYGNLNWTNNHLAKLKLRYCAGSNPARGVSEIRNGEDLWQCSRLEIRLQVFCQPTQPQKQFIIIIFIVTQITMRFAKVRTTKLAYSSKLNINQ